MARGTFYTTEKIGPKQSLTPEGFLLCEEVALARTGMMIYGPDETPISAGPDGVAKIFREDSEVFAPITIASAQGKSVTNDHPEEDVNPDNWHNLTIGICMNVRRGEGSMDDLMLGDLLITDPDGIDLIQSGKREISLGYEADYEEVNEGVGKQSNIIINHIALVEQGRCGPRCAISDSKPTMKGKTMAKRSKILDALMRAFKAKDADEVEQLAKEVTDEDFNVPDDGDTHIHIHAGGDTQAPNVADEDLEGEEGRAKFGDDDFQAFMEKNDAEHADMFARIEALEKLIAGGNTEDEDDPELTAALKDEAPEGLGEEAVKAKDSAYLADSFQDTVALAEILAPGIRVPTYDGAARPGQTFKKICGLRRQALDLAYVQPASRGMLDDLLSGKPLDTKNMTCDAIRVLFKSAAATQRTLNNSGGGTHDRTPQGASKQAGVTSLADLNRLNASRWTK